MWKNNRLILHVMFSCRQKRTEKHQSERRTEERSDLAERKAVVWRSQQAVQWLWSCCSEEYKWCASHAAVARWDSHQSAEREAGDGKGIEAVAKVKQSSKSREVQERATEALQRVVEAKKRRERKCDKNVAKAEKPTKSGEKKRILNVNLFWLFFENFWGFGEGKREEKIGKIALGFVDFFFADKKNEIFHKNVLFSTKQSFYFLRVLEPKKNYRGKMVLTLLLKKWDTKQK